MLCMLDTVLWYHIYHPNNPEKWTLLFLLFRCRTQSSERLSNLLKVTQLVNCVART